MKKQLLLFTMVLLPMVASAYDDCIDGICYNFNAQNKTATVTYKKESGWPSNITRYSDYSGEIIIPSNVIWKGVSYDVTGIGDWAFVECGKLTLIDIPTSITNIGKYAFVDCTNLKTITIPNSVTSIGKGAFNGCSGLTSVNISNGMTSIEEDVFYGCSGLTSVSIPSSVTSIGGQAFANCSGLTSVVISNNVESIGGGAFSGCSGLTSIEIPNGVKEIQGSAFADCSGLCSLIIPQSVTNIPYNAFYGCSGLTSIIVDEKNSTYDSRDNCNAIIETTTNTLICGCKKTEIPNTVTSIGEEAFRGCSGLTSIEIPNSVTSIGIDAFSGCSGLTSIEIPNGVISIEPFTFYNCSSLTFVIVPNSVTSMVYVFEGCGNLTDFYCYSEKIPVFTEDEFNGVPIEDATLHVPATLMESYKNKMPWSNFGHIVALPQITYMINGQTYKTSVIPVGDDVIAETEPEKKGYTFSGWSEIPSIMPDEDVTVTSTFTPNKYKLVYMVDDKEYKSVEVEYGATITPEVEPTKEGYIFSGWNGIPETMPASDVTITGSFAKDSNLFEEEGAGFEKQEDETLAFTEQKNVESSIEIPETVTHEGVGYRVTAIAEGAFKDNTNLIELSIPESIVSIGDDALAGCTNLEKIHIYSDKPISIDQADASSVFSGVDTENCILYVPAGTAEAYRQAEGWKAFKNIVEMEDPDDINDINAEDGSYQIYTIEGKQVEALQKGVNIIKYEKGSTKKVFVK